MSVRMRGRIRIVDGLPQPGRGQVCRALIDSCDLNAKEPVLAVVRPLEARISRRAGLPVNRLGHEIV